MTIASPSVAVIGASESTLWTYWLVRNLQNYRHDGEIWFVNPNRREVYGRACFDTIDDLPGVPTIGAIIVGASHAMAAVEQLLDAGTRQFVVISDGFREAATPEGAANEARLTQVIAEHGAMMVGPNCVGYASFHDRICAIAEPIPEGLHAGEVSVLSQSGSLTHSLLVAIQDERIGLDEVYSLGNGATFDLPAAIRHLAARETTRTICAIVESIGDRAELQDAVALARAAGKNVMFLMMGRSPAGGRIAQAHTGAVLGEYRLVRAWLEKLGVVVVQSLEELARAAALSRAVGRPSARCGVFVLTSSGGGAGLAADACATLGLPLAALTEETKRGISEHLASSVTIGNPLDVATRRSPDAARAVYDLVAADPNVGILLDPTGLTWADDSDERRWHRAGVERLVEAAEQAGVGLVYTSLMHQPESDFMLRVAERPGVSVGGTLTTTIGALARLYLHDDSEQTEPDPRSGPAWSAQATTDDSVLDEAQARAVLESLDYPTVRGVLAPSVSEAGDAAESMPPPFVAKVALAGLGHKGRIDGVHLGLSDRAAVEAACDRILTSIAEYSLGASEDVGFLIQEMVFGPEILVGFVRDAVAGPSVVIGVGGWSAEAGTIFAAVPLPASREVIAAEFGRSSGPRLLGQTRTQQLIDLVASLGERFVQGALEDYEVLELNPVIMATEGPKIADALLVRR